MIRLVEQSRAMKGPWPKTSSQHVEVALAEAELRPSRGLAGPRTMPTKAPLEAVLLSPVSMEHERGSEPDRQSVNDRANGAGQGGSGSEEYELADSSPA